MGSRGVVAGGASLLLALAVLVGAAHPAAALGRRDPIFPSASADFRPPTFELTYPLGLTSAWLEGALSLRSVELTTLTNEVTASSTLSTRDRGALQAAITIDSEGISALSQRVPTESTIPALQSDATAMIDTYHVIALLEPVVGEVLSTDATLATETQLATQETALAAAITAAQEAKRDVVAVEVYNRDLTRRLAEITAGLSGLSTSLLALAPTSWPEPRSALKSASSAVAAADANLNLASTDTSAIVRLLAHLGSRSVRAVRL